MIFSSEKTSATAINPCVAVLLENAVGPLLLGLRRGRELWGYPSEQVEGDYTNTLW